MRRWGPLLFIVACQAPPHPRFEPCPVLDRGCRIDTFLALEAERGQIWDPWAQPPAVTILSVPQLQRRLSILDARNRPAEAWSGWSAPLNQLGLLAPGTNVADNDHRWETDHIAAIYWPSEKEVSIIDRGGAFDDASAVATLTHEYTHAAQDREFGLTFDETGLFTTDGELVRQSLIEGEAGLYGTLAHLRMSGDDPERYDWDGYYRPWLMEVRNETVASDAPHTVVRRSLPYPAGGLLLAQAWQRGGSTGVNQLLLSPPRTFVSIMAALDGRPDPGPPRRLCPARLLPLDRFDLIDSDRLGAALFYAYLARTFGPESEAWQAALLWRGDQIWSLGDLATVQRAPVTFWRIHAPGLAATAIGARLAGQPGPPRLVGDDLVFWSGTDDAGVERLIAGTGCE